MRDHSVVQLNEIEAFDVMFQCRKEGKCNIMKEREQQVICTSTRMTDWQLVKRVVHSLLSTLSATLIGRTARDVGESQ